MAVREGGSGGGGEAVGHIVKNESGGMMTERAAALFIYQAAVDNTQPIPNQTKRGKAHENDKGTFLSKKVISLLTSISLKGWKSIPSRSRAVDYHKLG